MEINKNKKRIMFIVGLLLTLTTLILVGLTYAYYRTRIVGNEKDKSISVTSTRLEVAYQDGNAYFVLDSKEEELSNGEKSGIEPGDKFKKEFSVKNTGGDATSYSILLDELTNEFERNQDWTYILTKDGNKIAEGLLVVGTHQVLIGKEDIASGTEDNPAINNYVLTITYENLSNTDQSEDMGSLLKFRVNISNEINTWQSPFEGSLLAAIKSNQPEGTEETISGQEISTTNEARILTTEDDYGTSYVYRGNITNNYVTYSDMCWRIVRVQGDGTIKLTLADGNHSCGTSNGYSQSDTDSALIENNNVARTDIAQDNIITALTTWATNKNLDQSGIIENEWCDDRSDYSYYKLNEMDYLGDLGASIRLNKKNTLTPTLKCNMNGAMKTKNIFGTLTADEIAFAGAVSGNKYITNDNNTTYYLYANSSGVPFYWTMSRGNFFGNSLTCTGIGVSSDGELYKYQQCDWYNNFGEADLNQKLGSVRPSIVLRSDVMLDINILNQNGTQTNPYVIN